MPAGYDLYVVCLQEACSDDLFDAFEQRLSLQDGISRVDLAAVEEAAVQRAVEGGKGEGAAEGGGRPDYIFGRGDGSLLHPKFTGIAMCVLRTLPARAMRTAALHAQLCGRLTHVSFPARVFFVLPL